MTTIKRNIVICAEDTDNAAGACKWAIKAFYEEGDKFHLVYVAKALKPPIEIYHGLPGTSYQFNQPGAHDEQEIIAAAKAAIEARYLPILRERMVPYELHLYAENKDASPQNIAGIILKEIEERDAAIVVIAAHNRPVEDTFEGDVGSVTKLVIEKTKRPLAVLTPAMMTFNRS